MFSPTWTALSLESAKEPCWEPFAEYCKARGLSSHRQAGMIADRFADIAKTWSFEERKRFGLFFIERTGSNLERNIGSGGLLKFVRGAPSVFAPREIVGSVLLPTLSEWCAAEPDNAEPHFWLGLYGIDPHRDAPAFHLEGAVRLDPGHVLARVVLAILAIKAIDYHQHELPSGYLGEPGDDLVLLKSAREKLREGVDIGVRAFLEEDISRLESDAMSWVELRGKFSNLDWKTRMSVWQGRLQRS